VRFQSIRPSHHGIMTSPPLAVKRIMQEARELANDPSTEYSAAPLEVRYAFLPAFMETNASLSLSLLVCNFRTISLYAWVFSQCTSLIKPDYRSGTAHCVGHLEPTLRVDCTTFVSGCLLNIHFDRQVSCYLLPTADSN